MSADLKDLLEQAVHEPPAEKHSVGDVVRRAERSRRTHRLLTTTGIAASIAAIAAAGVLVASTVPHGTGGQRPEPAQRGVVGAVVHPRDAKPASAGQFTVDSRHLDPNLDQGNDRLYDQVTDDGSVLVSQPTLRDPSDQMTEYNRYGLIAAGSDRVIWLPSPPTAQYSDQFAPSGPDVVDVADGKVLWQQLNQANTAPTRFSVYDLRARTWNDFAVPSTQTSGSLSSALSTSLDARIGAGRIWYGGATRRDRGGDSHQLYSIPLDGQGKPRFEGWVGDWDVQGDTLAYSDARNRPIDKLTVRDLTSGASQTFDPQSGDRCNQLGLTLSGDRIALQEYCGTRDRVRDDRVQVVGTDGSPVVTVQGNDLAGGALGDNVLGVQQYSGGTFFYDFRSKTLYRISAGAAKFGDGPLAGGSTIVWTTPYDHRHGMRLWSGTWK